MIEEKHKIFDLTIREIAAGIHSIHSRGEMMMDIYPYPKPLQQGFDRLTWLYQQRKVTPPQSVMELLHWCAKPFSEWPSVDELLPKEWESTDQLLAWWMPTQFCHELYIGNLNVADELLLNQHFIKMLEECRSLQAQSGYVQFRRLFIEHPLIESVELQEKVQQFSSVRMRQLIREAYEFIPETFSKNGQLDVCGSCGYLRQPIEGRLKCEQEVCFNYFPKAPARYLSHTSTLLRLKRPFRRYISFPGLAELRLANNLQKLGLKVELWPQFDRYDLHITFPKGTSWAIDVKDWSNPYLLGRSLKEIPYSGDFSRFYYVVPNYRLTYRADYTRAVESQSLYIKGATKVVSERQFIRAVKKQITGI